MDATECMEFDITLRVVETFSDEEIISQAIGAEEQEIVETEGVNKSADEEPQSIVTCIEIEDSIANLLDCLQRKSIRYHLLKVRMEIFSNSSFILP